MFVGFARYDLRLPASGSLKDKRSVIRTLRSMLTSKFDCAFAEVEHQDLRQRGAVGVAVVSSTSFHARKVLAEVSRHVETHPGVELIDARIDVVKPEDL
jgi:uncharacterized protein YlxP (DUF503 family)